jgi:hypothetical protein
VAQPKTQNDRVKASKLRAKKAAGKTLSPTETAWLADYERDSVRAKGRKAIAQATTATATGAVVRGPQLQLHGATAGGTSHAHETVPVAGRIDPQANTWIPVMPEQPTDAPPPPDGAPPPPSAGTPLVDPPPTSSSGAPTGDPAAAAQFSAFVMFMASVGLDAGLEMLADGAYPVPPNVRAMLATDEFRATVIGQAGQAAERVAVKYGFRAVPLADEAVVAVAVAGSGLLFLANAKRKRLRAANAQRSEETPTENPPTEQRSDFPDDPVNRLWARARGES